MNPIKHTLYASVLAFSTLSVAACGADDNQEDTRDLELAAHEQTVQFSELITQSEEEDIEEDDALYLQSGTPAQQTSFGCVEGEVETVASFEGGFIFTPEGPVPNFVGDTPEGITFNKWGTRAYVSQALSGEITEVKLWNGEVSAFAQMDLGFPNEFCPIGIMGEIESDWKGNLYINVNSCAPGGSGIWKISKSGDTELLAPYPLGGIGNGIEIVGNYVYSTDSNNARVYRAPLDNDGSEVEVFVEDALLSDPVPFPVDTQPGPNGIHRYGDELWVANPAQFTVVAVPLNGDAPYVLHEGVGLDGFDVLWDGTIIGTTDPFQTLLEIQLDGTVTELLGAADGLDGPTAIRFHPWLYGRAFITNAQFPFFPPTGNGASLMSYQYACLF